MNPNQTDPNAPVVDPNAGQAVPEPAAPAYDPNAGQAVPEAPVVDAPVAEEAPASPDASQGGPVAETPVV